jgi:hypothetical protein
MWRSRGSPCSTHPDELGRTRPPEGADEARVPDGCARHRQPTESSRKSAPAIGKAPTRFLGAHGQTLPLNAIAYGTRSPLRALRTPTKTSIEATRGAQLGHLRERREASTARIRSAFNASLDPRTGGKVDESDVSPCSDRQPQCAWSTNRDIHTKSAHMDISGAAQACLALRPSRRIRAAPARPATSAGQGRRLEAGCSRTGRSPRRPLRAIRPA